MSDLNLLLCVILGALIWPLLKATWFVLRVTRVAVYDTIWVARNAELKDGFSRWHWLHILPNRFCKSWVETAFHLWNGVERVL